MKTRITFIIALLISITSIAQQQGINYKALIKDANGNALNTFMNVQFTIHAISPTGSIVYQEDHNYTTVDGLLILNIGSDPSPIVGVFADIDWVADIHFLNTTITYSAGTIDLGTTQFMAVPYAKHADTATIATTALNAGASNINDLSDGKTSSTAVYLGTGAGFTETSPNRWNVGVGTGALYSNTSGDLNTANGFGSLYSNTSGDLNTAYGAEALYYNQTGFGNVALGYFAGYNETGSNKLYIANSGTSTPLIYGEFDNEVLNLNGKTTINSNTTGLVINSGLNSAGPFGLKIYGEGGGIQINSYGGGWNGIEIISSVWNGVYVNSAENHGGSFTGVTSGVYAESSNNANADIVLGGTGNTTTGDDGIIASDPDYAGSDIFIRSNDAVVIRLDYDNNESGNFEIKNSTNTEVFDVSEAGNVVIAGSLTQNSDRRLKKDIKTLPYGLKEVLQLQPKAYNWKDRTQKNKSLGLIAQDVQTIIKEVVAAKDDDAKTLGISYTELIPVLINAIKEQNTIINNQDLRNRENEKTTTALLERIEKLEALNNQ